MQNKSVTKILLWIFIIWISFLWYNVFAAWYKTQADDPGDCVNVKNYNTDKYSQTTNPKWNVDDKDLTDNPHWFYNNEDALKWRYKYHSGDVSISGDVDAIIAYKLNFYQRFNWAAGYNDYGPVRSLQQAFESAWCVSVIKDCKLWTKTSENFFKWCKNEGENCTAFSWWYKDPIGVSPIACAIWYEEVTEWSWAGLCCKKIELLPPDILVNEIDCSCDDNKDDCEFNVEDGPLNVEVDYLVNEKIDLQVWNTGLISIDGWTMSGMTVDLTRKIIKFQITPSKNTVKIIVWNWVMKASWTNEDIPWNNAPLTISWCNNLPVNWECTAWYVLCNGCCSECSTPSTWWDCSGYGSWYVSYLDWACCKFDCSVWSGCNPWKKWNETKCKCVCDPSQTCCGIQLNTVVPFIWDCIEMVDSDTALGLNVDTASSRVTQITAFPYLMMWLTKIVVTAILILSVIIVIASGVLMVTWGIWWDWYSKWTKLLKNVIISLILLWCSWLILKLINPTFFGG